MFPFDTSSNITNILKEQWAGLFQDMLNERIKIDEISIIKKLEKQLLTANQMVEHIVQEKSQRDEVINTIVTQNHPIFSRIAEVTKTPYRVFFLNKDEMNTWLGNRRWSHYEDWDCYMHWQTDSLSGVFKRILAVKEDLFQDDGRLRQIDPSEWDDDWIQFEDEPAPSGGNDDLDDEIPF